MKVQTEVVVQEVKKYIADDGKAFWTEADCKKYEKDLARADLKAKLDLIECCKEAEGWTPLDGCEYMEYHDYHWYRPKTSEEANVLHEWFELEFPIEDDEIGQWICIEECDDCAWSYAMNYSIIHTLEFFEKFGYHVTITKEVGSDV
jgi:hypothetical protein